MDSSMGFSVNGFFGNRVLYSQSCILKWHIHILATERFNLKSFQIHFIAMGGLFIVSVYHYFLKSFYSVMNQFHPLPLPRPNQTRLSRK